MSETNEITFQDLNIPEKILAALEKKGYGYPTRVQAEAIPPLMAWKDVIAKAPTGTGKTFAFGIPMIAHTDPASHIISHPSVPVKRNGSPAPESNGFAFADPSLR